jgi:hypothetical protein
VFEEFDWKVRTVYKDSTSLTLVRNRKKIDVVDANEETVSPILGPCLYMNRLTSSPSTDVTEETIHARRKNVLPADSLQGIAFQIHL